MSHAGATAPVFVMRSGAVRIRPLSLAGLDDRIGFTRSERLIQNISIDFISFILIKARNRNKVCLEP